MPRVHDRDLNLQAARLNAVLDDVLQQDGSTALIRVGARPRSDFPAVLVMHRVLEPTETQRVSGAGDAAPGPARDPEGRPGRKDRPPGSPGLKNATHTAIRRGSFPPGDRGGGDAARGPGVFRWPMAMDRRHRGRCRRVVLPRLVPALALGQARLDSAERRAQAILEQADREADTSSATPCWRAREEALHLKQEVEREILAARNAQLEAERAFQQKEAAFNRRVELIDKKERDLKSVGADIGAARGRGPRRGHELDKLIASRPRGSSASPACRPRRRASSSSRPSRARPAPRPRGASSRSARPPSATPSARRARSSRSRSSATPATTSPSRACRWCTCRATT